jgi:hypothetical protein
MTVFNPKLAAAIAAAVGATPTKINYSNAIGSDLGNTRRLRAFRDANPAAPNPAATGVEFLNIGSSGPLTYQAGNIVGFGTLSGTTVRAAADLSTGVSVLVLEGNGSSITFTLGLTGSGKEFTLGASPTGSPNEGVAFTAAAKIRAPVAYDSGSGPLSPQAVANTPYSATVQDWSSGSAVDLPPIILDVKLPNWVFDDAELATSMGDCAVYQSTQSAVLDDIEFGVTVWGINPSINSQGAEPVYKALVVEKPTEANWPGWPAYSGYNQAVSNTFAKPHKVVIKNQAGAVLYIHQMRDGKPINDPSLYTSKFNNEINVKPLRPFMHCAAALPWTSSRPKLNTYASKYFPGAAADSLAPHVSRSHYTYNPPVMPVYGLTQLNGVSCPHSMPKWSLPGNATAVDAAAALVQDPYLYNIVGTSAGYGDVGHGVNFIIGWGYEPGSFSGHDQACGVGGLRLDRYVIPFQYAAYMTNPNYLRPFNMDPIIDMAEDFGKSAYNLPNFFVTNVKTAATIPLEEVFNNEWSMGGGYYDPNNSYTAGGSAKSIYRFGPFAGDSYNPALPFGGEMVDKNGRTPFNGAGPDFLHNFWSFAWDTLLFNCPMAAYATKHRLISSILCQAEWIAEDHNVIEWYLVRQHAWRWMHYTMAWKVSADHPLGIPRAPVEKRFEKELIAIHEQIVVPSRAVNPYLRIASIKNLGCPTRWDGQMASHGMTFYLAHVIHLMRQTGLWDVLYNKSVQCREALEFTVHALDLYSIDWILDTQGREPNYTPVHIGDPQTGMATSWADWSTRVRPRNGQEDWITNPDGSIHRDGGFGQEHLRYQWVCFRRDYPLGIPCVRANGIALAAAAFKDFYDRIDARVATQSDPRDKSGVSWLYYGPQTAAIKPPVA